MQRVVKGGETQERERRTGVREAQRGGHGACSSLKGGQWGEGVWSACGALGRGRSMWGEGGRVESRQTFLTAATEWTEKDKSLKKRTSFEVLEDHILT